jgi:hypothetical protein
MPCKLSVLSNPPPRGVVERHSSVLNSRQNTLIRPPPDIKPTNHLSISRKDGTIEGSFVIDTSLFMPEYRYSSISTKTDKAERNNLMLYAHGGAVNVDIWLMPKEPQTYARIRVRAKDGITVKLVRILIQLRSDLT